MSLIRGPRIKQYGHVNELAPKAKGPTQLHDHTVRYTRPMN